MNTKSFYISCASRLSQLGIVASATATSSSGASISAPTKLHDGYPFQIWKIGDEEDDSRTDSVLELIRLCKIVIGGEGTDDQIDCGEKADYLLELIWGMLDEATPYAWRSYLSSSPLKLTSRLPSMWNVLW
jgi:hypothetical protein